MKPTFFSTSTDFRKWLSKNHKKKNELLVGFYKVQSERPSMTWSESVDQALCFGWIDGVRNSLDHDSYTIRFTPRKPDSIWSKVNLKKMEELISSGLMQPAGLEVFGKRQKERSGLYSHERDKVALSELLIKKFKSHKKAWDFFSTQAPSYQKVCAHWVTSAKQEATQNSRLMRVITASEAGKRLR